MHTRLLLALLLLPLACRDDAKGSDGTTTGATSTSTTNECSPDNALCGAEFCDGTLVGAGVCCDDGCPVPATRTCLPGGVWSECNCDDPFEDWDSGPDPEPWPTCDGPGGTGTTGTTGDATGTTGDGTGASTGTGSTSDGSTSN